MSTTKEYDCDLEEQSFAKITESISFDVNYITTIGNDIIDSGERFTAKIYPKWIDQCGRKKKFEIIVWRADEHGRPNNKVRYYYSLDDLLSALSGLVVTPDTEWASKRIEEAQESIAQLKLHYGL